jgi:hypothetical protein
MILIPGGIRNIVNADTQLHKNDALGNQRLVGQGLATAPCPGGESPQCRPSPGAGRSRNGRPGGEPVARALTGDQQTWRRRPTLEYITDKPEETRFKNSNSRRNRQWRMKC